jgi:Mlc titration factor MtfA (ptsG expression regulator)
MQSLIAGWSRWRRARILRRHRIDDALWNDVMRDVRSARHLSDEERRRLHELASLFLHRKTIEPARDIAITEPMRVRIAAESCVPVLNLSLDLYDGWYSVIVYPDEFIVRHEYMDEAGVVHDGEDMRAGESWHHGPVIVSWADIVHGEPGTNVVIHEMAHKLDQLDGTTNGCPPLHADMDQGEWTRAFSAAFDELVRDAEAGRPSAIDPYGAEDPGEFFAVVSETFFDMPRLLRGTFPAVYGQLALYYRQDPLS